MVFFFELGEGVLQFFELYFGYEGREGGEVEEEILLFDFLSFSVPVFWEALYYVCLVSYVVFVYL